MSSAHTSADHQATGAASTTGGSDHPHVFLGADHEQNERKTWAVIALCGVMMVVEIGGGSVFGSLAVVADGLHMSTHTAALLIAAFAYTYARRHSNDDRFVFGTGKLGDLAGFTSATILAMIALVIGFEAVRRFMSPVTIHFNVAIPIAVVGLFVNVLSAWLLSGEGHHHDHGHHDSHGDDEHAQDDEGHHHVAQRDNNMRAAYVHVLADAAVSVLAILGLLTARYFGWVWMDPMMGIVGAIVIANWAYRLVRDTGRVLLDMTPDAGLTKSIRTALETEGDTVSDLHIWRVGPGHLGAVISVATSREQSPADYKARLAGIADLSHVTVEVQNRLAPARVSAMR
jgi:cation diffusion facilitator family transporter